MPTLLDAALLTGATARLIRAAITDDIGAITIREPVYRWQDRWLAKHPDVPRDQDPPALPIRLTDMVDCPWCLGTWIGYGAVTSLAVAEKTGHRRGWRWAAAGLALNYVVVQVMGRLGDFDDPHTRPNPSPANTDHLWVPNPDYRPGSTTWTPPAWATTPIAATDPHGQIVDPPDDETGDGYQPGGWVGNPYQLRPDETIIWPDSEHLDAFREWLAAHAPEGWTPPTAWPTTTDTEEQDQ